MTKRQNSQKLRRKTISKMLEVLSGESPAAGESRSRPLLGLCGKPAGDLHGGIEVDAACHIHSLDGEMGITLCELWLLLSLLHEHAHDRAAINTDGELGNLQDRETAKL